MQARYLIHETMVEASIRLDGTRNKATTLLTGPAIGGYRGDSLYSLRHAFCQYQDRLLKVDWIGDMRLRHNFEYRDTIPNSRSDACKKVVSQLVVHLQFTLMVIVEFNWAGFLSPTGDHNLARLEYVRGEVLSDLRIAGCELKFGGCSNLHPVLRCLEEFVIACEHLDKYAVVAKW